MDSYYTMDASLLQQTLRNQDDHPLLAKRYEAPTKFDFDKIESFDREHKSRSDRDNFKQNSTEDEPKMSQVVMKYDITAATFMDVGVLRCLFMSHWQEEGVYWSLHYFNNRYEAQSQHE